MESQSGVKLCQWARVENAPKMSEANRREGAKRGEAGRKDPHKSESVALCVWQCHLRNVSTLSNRTPVFEEDGKWIALAEEMV